MSFQSFTYISYAQNAILSNRRSSRNKAFNNPIKINQKLSLKKSTPVTAWHGYQIKTLDDIMPETREGRSCMAVGERLVIQPNLEKKK